MFLTCSAFSLFFPVGFIVIATAHAARVRALSDWSRCSQNMPWIVTGPAHRLSDGLLFHLSGSAL